MEAVVFLSIKNQTIYFSEDINLIESIQNNSPNTNINTVIPNEDNLIMKIDVDLSNLNNSSYEDINEKELAFIPSQSSPFNIQICSSIK